METRKYFKQMDLWSKEGERVMVDKCAKSDLITNKWYFEQKWFNNQQVMCWANMI